MPSETTESAADENVDADVGTDAQAAPPDDASEETGEKPWHMRHARELAATVVASVVVIMLLTVAGGVLWWVRAQHDHQQRDSAITLAARDAALTLLTLNPDDVQGSLDRVLAASTGGWRQQFAQNSDQFTQVVRNGKVRTTATISASAIQNADDSRATVLVSANAVISNTESPQGYPAVYRVLMVLESQDGRWLVSDLQFVA